MPEWVGISHPAFIQAAAWKELREGAGTKLKPVPPNPLPRLWKRLIGPWRLTSVCCSPFPPPPPAKKKKERYLGWFPYFLTTPPPPRPPPVENSGCPACHGFKIARRERHSALYQVVESTRDSRRALNWCLAAWET